MKFFNKKETGFTLIELLVVIAIIGILAAIVLVNVRSARTKAEDAAIKGNLATMSAGAEMYYEDQSPGTYAGFCAGDHGTKVGDKLTDLSPSAPQCLDADGGWASCAELNEAAGVYWCVDAEGNAKEVSTCSGTQIGASADSPPTCN